MTNFEYIEFLKETIETSHRELRRVLMNLKKAEENGRKYNETIRECVDLAIPTPSEIIGGKG